MKTYSERTSAICPGPAPQPKVGLAALGRILSARMADAATRHHALAHFKELLGMSDYMLEDIGLTRADVLQDRLRYRLTGELPGYIGRRS